MFALRNLTIRAKRYHWGLPMIGFIVLIRNLVLAAVLAWLGLEFAPDQQDSVEAPDSGAVTSVIAGL